MDCLHCTDCLDCHGDLTIDPLKQQDRGPLEDQPPAAQRLTSQLTDKEGRKRRQDYDSIRRRRNTASEAVFLDVAMGAKSRKRESKQKIAGSCLPVFRDIYIYVCVQISKYR